MVRAAALAGREDGSPTAAEIEAYCGVEECDVEMREVMLTEAARLREVDVGTGASGGGWLGRTRRMLRPLQPSRWVDPREVAKQAQRARKEAKAKARAAKLEEERAEQEAFRARLRAAAAAASAEEDESDVAVEVEVEVLADEPKPSPNKVKSWYDAGTRMRK